MFTIEIEDKRRLTFVFLFIWYAPLPAPSLSIKQKKMRAGGDREDLWMLKIKKKLFKSFRFLINYENAQKDAHRYSHN